MMTTCAPVCDRPCGGIYPGAFWDWVRSRGGGYYLAQRSGVYDIRAERLARTTVAHACRPMFASVPANVTCYGVTPTFRLSADCYVGLRTAMAANATARDVQ